MTSFHFGKYLLLFGNFRFVIVAWYTVFYMFCYLFSLMTNFKTKM